MKKGIILLIVATFLIVGGIGYSFIQANKAEATTTAAQKIINVDELAAKPADYPGDIILTGVVAGINKAEGVFGVIDAREFKSCGVLSCARYTLPVKYRKAAPALKSFVHINGRLANNKNGMIIIAAEVKLVK